MNRNEQEMALWRDAYMETWTHDTYPTEASGYADASVAEFRKRYPPQPSAPAAVWYDEPPFEKDGESYPCWIAGKLFPAAVFWNVDEWQVVFAGEYHARSLRGRRVSPITKPPEPRP